MSTNLSGRHAESLPHAAETLSPCQDVATTALQTDSKPKNQALARTWLYRIGLLLPITLAYFLTARLLHQSHNISAGYTWEFTYQVTRNILAQPGTVSLLFVAFLVGRLRLQEPVSLAALSQQLRQPITWQEVRRWRIPECAGLCALLLAVDAVVFEGHSTVDSFCILCATVLAFYSPQRISLPRAALLLVLTALVHTLSSYTFTVFKALLFVLHPPQDVQIMHWEALLFGEPPHRAVARWAAAHPGLIFLADSAYLYLIEHMMLVSAFLVGARQLRERNEYLSALTLCTLLGGALYHLVPGYGPLWHDADTFRHLAYYPLHVNGIASGLSYSHSILQLTPRGLLRTYMYIACMPSLHIANETVMLWYARHSRITFVLSLGSFGLTTFATLALGWHYMLDVIFGALFAVTVIQLCRRIGRRWLPATLDAPNARLPLRRPPPRLVPPTPTPPAISRPSTTRFPS